MKKANYSDNSVATQRLRILNWLMHNSSLTTQQARREMDIMSPAARIFELKEEGHNILTHWEREKTASGDTRAIAKYILMGRPS